MKPHVSQLLVVLSLACNSACASLPPGCDNASSSGPHVGPRVGQLAPDFRSHDQDGKPVQLSTLRGKHVVVYFYPRDETPGCTKEACSFRDAWKSLLDRGVVIIGISTDSDESHRAFAKNHQLPFTLVSDPKGTIAGQYCVPVQLGFTHRQSFVIARDGRVQKIYRKVDVAVHATEIAGDLKQ